MYLVVGWRCVISRRSIHENPSGTRSRTPWSVRSTQGDSAGAQHREVQHAVRSVGLPRGTSLCWVLLVDDAIVAG